MKFATAVLIAFTLIVIALILGRESKPAEIQVRDMKTAICYTISTSRGV